MFEIRKNKHIAIFFITCALEIRILERKMKRNPNALMTKYRSTFDFSNCSDPRTSEIGGFLVFGKNLHMRISCNSLTVSYVKGFDFYQRFTLQWQKILHFIFHEKYLKILPVFTILKSLQALHCNVSLKVESIVQNQQSRTFQLLWQLSITLKHTQWVKLSFLHIIKGAAYFEPNGALVDGNKVPVELEGWNFHWGPNFWNW